VRENLDFWVHLLGGDSEKIPLVLDFFNLGAFEDVPARALSSGQLQRLSLTRLGVVPRPLWLLDEPLTALDGRGQALLQGLFETHLGQGGVILLATHHGDKRAMVNQARSLNLEDFRPTLGKVLEEAWL